MKIKELFEEDYTQIENLPLSAKIKLIRGKGGKVPLHKVVDNELVFAKQLIITPSYLDNKGEVIVPIAKTGQLLINASRFSSFKNCPKQVGDYGYTMGRGGTDWTGSVVIASNNEVLTSLEGFPTEGVKGVRLGLARNIDYHNVNLHIPEVYPDSMFEISSEYEGPILAFLRIKGLKRLWQWKGYAKQKPLAKAVVILNNYLASDRDILGCQEELIDAGLKEYAKL